MFRIPHLIFGMRDSMYKYFKSKIKTDMPTLTELIKESLEGKLSDQIRASLEADEASENSNEADSGESNP